jgi:hypothetical protein
MAQVGQAGDTLGVYDAGLGGEFGTASQLAITGIFGFAITGLFKIFYDDPLYVFLHMLGLCLKDQIVFSGQQHISTGSTYTQQQSQNYH